MNKQKLDPEKLHLQLTRMWGGDKRSELKSENLNTTHAKSCLHRGTWNGQQYDRSLHTLMCSVIPSHNNIIKLPLTRTRSKVEGPSILTPNLVGHALLQNLLSRRLVILKLLPIGIHKFSFDMIFTSMHNGLPISYQRHFQKYALSKGKRTWTTLYGSSNGGLHGMHCSGQWIMSLAWVILCGGLACTSVITTLCIDWYYHALVFLAHYVLFDIIMH